MKKQRMREIIAEAESVRLKLIDLHDTLQGHTCGERLGEILSLWPRSTEEPSPSSDADGAIVVTVRGIPLYPGYGGQHSFIATPGIAFAVPHLDGVTITVHSR